MRKHGLLAALCLATIVAIGSLALHAQELVDRIVARVENDIILLSDVRALALYQQLVQGQSETQAQILDRLIDQWIVRNEAETARFPHPTEAEVDKGFERVQKSFNSIQEYQAKTKSLGLTGNDVRKMVAAQLYLTQYLDSRFRPSVQVDDRQIDDFYQNAVVPRAQAHNEPPPPLDAARQYILEALIEKAIDEQAERWLAQSRARVHVEKMLGEAPQ